MNTTDYMKNRLIILVLIGILLPLSFAISSSTNHNGFEVNSAFVKLSLKQNESVVRHVEITSHEARNFKIRVIGTDAISVGEKEFEMGKGEKKIINISMDSYGKAPGVYFGKLIISGDDDVAIPVIMDVESSDVLFDGTLNVPIDDVNIYSGENMAIDNKVFNLDNIGAKNVQVTYLLKSFDGKTIFSDEQNIVVQGHISNTEVVSIPKDTAPGDYLFIAIMKYKNSVGTTSYFFNIKKKPVAESSTSSFAWIAVIALILLIFFVIYYTLKRDSVLLELKRQYQEEIEARRGELRREQLMLSDLKNKERTTILKKIKEKYKEKKRATRKIYKHRVAIAKKLKKEKRLNEIDVKLREWKKAGYNIGEIESPKNISKKSLLKKYREEGYNL